eukprot:scaffold30166_cov132-Isochrysis_galbana.AAC.3
MCKRGNARKPHRERERRTAQLGITSERMGPCAPTDSFLVAPPQPHTHTTTTPHVVVPFPFRVTVGACYHLYNSATPKRLRMGPTTLIIAHIFPNICPTTSRIASACLLPFLRSPSPPPPGCSPRVGQRRRGRRGRPWASDWMSRTRRRGPEGRP